jgi:tetratricopeptide (TPR) repeat protein
MVRGLLQLRVAVRAHTDSGVAEVPKPPHPRAVSRPATDLGAIARGEPRVEELLAVLEGATEPARRVYILQEVARVYVDDLDDPAAASVALRAALQEDHDPAIVVGALADLAEAGGRWGELLAELMEDAGELGHEQPRRAADLWVQIARWYDDPVGYREYATRAVREALELVPHHAEALATLAAFLRDDGYWVELAGVIQRQVAVAVDDAERVALYLSLAEVAEGELGEPITAIGACRSALDLDADCAAAFDRLRSLVRRPEAAGEVAGLLAERAPAIRDPEARVALLIEVARLHGDQLDEAARAEEIWDAIEDRDRAIARLKALIEAGTSRAEAAALHYRIGRFLLRGDADPGRAEWHLSQALAEDPGHAAPARILSDLYRDRGDWLKASRMLDRASEHAGAGERTALVIANARILADQLGDLEAAVAVCERARDAGATDSAIGRMLVALYARLGRWSELQPMVADLEREVVGRRARTETGALYHIIARAASELGDDDRAFAYYYEARAADRADIDVIRGLADQYYERSRWREAADEYLALLEAGPADSDRAAIQYRLGVSLRELGDEQGALEAFNRVLEREADHLPAATAVAELLVRARRWGDAARAKAALLELAPADERPRLQVELGDLYRDHLNQPRRALACYSAAVEADPTNHAALQRRLDAATAAGDWATVIDSIERFAAAETVALRRGSYL